MQDIRKALMGGYADRMAPMINGPDNPILDDYYQQALDASPYDQFEQYEDGTPTSAAKTKRFQIASGFKKKDDDAAAALEAGDNTGYFGNQTFGGAMRDQSVGSWLSGGAKTMGDALSNWNPTALEAMGAPAKVLTEGFADSYGDAKDASMDYYETGDQNAVAPIFNFATELSGGGAVASQADDLARGALGSNSMRGMPELPMDEASRMARATEQGYGDDVWYHGTGDDVTNFDINHPNRMDTGWLGTGAYMTSDPGLASAYSSMKPGPGNVMPLRTKMKNPYHATLREKQRMQMISNNQGLEAGRQAADDWTAELQGRGHDGVLLKYDPKDVGEASASTEALVFDPSGVRSTNARFDPAYEGSSTLLGANAGDSRAAIAAALAGFDRNRDLPKDAANLLKGRTDEEVARLLQTSKMHDALAGNERRTSGPRSGDNWFPGANVKLGTSVPDLDAGLNVIPRHNYDSPVTDISWESQQGKTMIPFVGDRTGVGTLTHIGGDLLDDPVSLYGGKDYMRGAEEGVWASAEGALTPVSKFAAATDNPLGVYMPMAGTGSDFAHMTENALDQVWKPNQLTSDGADLVNTYLRTGKGVDGVFPDAPDVGSAQFAEMIRNDNPLRKAYIQALDKKNVRDEGGPDMGAIRHAITDPELRNVPNPTADVMNEQLMGWGAADIDPTGAMRRGNHPTYDTDIGGDYLGRLPLIPRSLGMRDWNRMRREKAPTGYAQDPRSIFTGPTQVPQVIDQEMIDAISGYQSLLRQQQ
tara:strand:+ start:214 stop:2493 length:2280 start_codon:yes stop_codon:yes gene_type:complete